VKAEIQLKIEAIDEKSPHLSTVIELWRANAATLGLLPKGAFEQRAASGQILVALDPQAACIAYLLYRCSYNRITIVHLCISRIYRSQGVARLLVDKLKQITKEKYTGIGLSCRRDYQLHYFWSRFGFVAQHDKAGKSRDKKLLTFWWFDHGHPNLFSSAPTQKLESKLCVVIDASIFSDLFSDEVNDQNEESKLLISDWLEPELELCLTNEIFNNIDRICDEHDRNRQREFAKTFTRLPSPSQSLDTLFESLQSFLFKKSTVISELDLRHLGRTITSDSQVFVTKLNDLLILADEIYKEFRLSILTPNDLLIQLDELRRKPDYQPVRLAGTLLEIKQLKPGQEDFLAKYFQCDKQGENRAEFQQQLRRFLAEPDKFECYVVEQENKPLALFIYGKKNINELEIPIFRVGDNSLSATLARHLIFKSVLRSAHDHRQFTRITDSYLEETVTTVIQEDAFVRVHDGWVKTNLAVVETASQLSTRLNTLASTLGEEYKFCRQIADSLITENLINDVQASANIERFLFPAKIIDAEIPTFIIPIKPRWAKDLFDEGLANQNVLGGKTELAFSREAVFYRSIRNLRGLKSPGRLLWYVSQDEDNYYYKVSSIRACCFIDEVVIGKPKELYQRFQRLGVYELTDILNVNQDKNGNIMAIRFSNIELFSHPIPLNKVQDILRKKETIQSPCKICNDFFKKLYNLGIGNQI